MRHKALIEVGGANVDFQAENRGAALHVAASVGNVESVEVEFFVVFFFSFV